MLKLSKLQRGSRVFRVALVDPPDDGLSMPCVLEYEVTQLGTVFMEVRYVYCGRQAGKLGGADKANLGLMLARYFHTPLEAVVEAQKRAADDIRFAKARIIENERQAKELATLREGVLAAINRGELANVPTTGKEEVKS